MEKRKLYPAAAHLFFWILIVLQSVFAVEGDFIPQYGFVEVLYKQLFFYFGLVSIFYLNYFYLFPRLFSNKKYWKYFTAAFLCIIFSYFWYCLHGYYFDLRWKMTGDLEYRIKTPDVIAFHTFFYFVISSGLRVFDEWRRSLRLKEALNAAELALLKHQFSQHFLFNTLNTLYAMSLKKSDDVPAAILKLSNLLRYSLKKELNEKIPLSSDIEFIADYIDLQTMRIRNHDIIRFISSGVNGSHYIYPLLIIPFVENAFKHSDPLAENAEISFSIITEGNQFKFSSVNNIGENNDISQSTGIGIENVKKRLDILYKNKYSLEIIDDGLLFKVKLRIELA